MRTAIHDPEVAYRRRWLTLLVLCISLIVIVLDNTILNVAIPTLAHPTAQGGLGATASQLQWIVDAYTLVFAGLLLTAGSLGDRFGRYRCLAIGLAVFGIGSALSAFAPSANMLIGTRALMGIGGAFIMPSTLSIITNVFTDPAERWQGDRHLGRRVGARPRPRPDQRRLPARALLVGIDLHRERADRRSPGSCSATCSSPSRATRRTASSIRSARCCRSSRSARCCGRSSRRPSKGWGSAPIVAGFVIGALLLAAFFTWELRSSHPMLDMHFFQNPRFSAASGAITLVFLSLFGTLFLLTQYLQSVLGYSTVKAGAVLLPQAAVIMTFAPLSNVWVQRFGNKIVVTAGLLIVTTSMVLFTTFQPNSSVLHVIGITMLMGLGMANVMAPCTDSIMGSLPRAKAGVGSAVNDTTRQMGGAIGVAVFGSIMASHFTSSITTKLDGHLPARLLAAVSNNVGQTIGIANDPGTAPSVAAQIGGAARESFISGLHIIGIAAMAVTLIAALGVALFLPARARPEAQVGAPPEPELEPVPVASGVS